jgi:bacterioferritin-associated ferredoxin
MYVCLCMAITDAKAREVIVAGAGTAGQILRACGTARPCGGCTPTLRQLLRDAQAESERDMDDVIEMNRYREAR